MAKDGHKKGYSLTEVLLAVATLSLGMICIAGVFPVALHYNTVATERTIAAVVADEAFAKIRLLAGDPALVVGLAGTGQRIQDLFDPAEQRDFQVEVDNARSILLLPLIADSNFVYPSDGRYVPEAQYCWTAICRRMGPDSADMQVTVFVCRKPRGAALPVALDVEVTGNQGDFAINVTDLDTFRQTAIRDGATIIEDSTGETYRVLSRDDTGLVTLGPHKAWRLTGAGLVVWTVTPLGSGRNPCIGVFQRVIQF